MEQLEQLEQLESETETGRETDGAAEVVAEEQSEAGRPERPLQAEGLPHQANDSTEQAENALQAESVPTQADGEVISAEELHVAAAEEHSEAGRPERPPQAGSLPHQANDDTEQAENAPRAESLPHQADADAISAEELLAAVDSPTVESSEDAQLKALLEAVIYITEEPLSLAQIAAATRQPTNRVQRLLDELVTEYDKPEHGVTVREVAGGYKMTTKPEHHEMVRSFVKSLKPPLKLSLPALETLAVIAYKQPVTAPEIMEIRGVQGAGVLKTLLDRKLIAAAGRKNVIGKPILYKTTRDFLLQFGLKDLTELPSLKEFEEIRRMSIDGETPEAAPSPAPPVSEPPSSEPAVAVAPAAEEPAADQSAETANEPVAGPPPPEEN